MLSATYAKCHLYSVSLMLSAVLHYTSWKGLPRMNKMTLSTTIKKLVILSVIILSVVILIVIILSVIILRVVIVRVVTLRTGPVKKMKCC
jgi:heme/copper-type cytochrome/quinol oxidase subunit 2